MVLGIFVSGMHCENQSKRRFLIEHEEHTTLIMKRCCVPEEHPSAPPPPSLPPFLTQIKKKEDLQNGRLKALNTIGNYFYNNC